jgi:hypothetical protein
MKKLLLNQQEREAVRLGTFIGAQIKLNLAIMRLKRDTYRQHGYLKQKKAERIIMRIVNMKLLGRDSKKKWYQIF